MVEKEKEKKSSSKLKKFFKFFGGIFRSCEDTSPIEDESSVSKASDEIVNGESVGRKGVLVDGSKGNDDSKTSSKDYQDKDNKDLSGLVRREVDFPENGIITVKNERERQSARNLIQNGYRQNKSKSVEALRDRQASVRSKSPKPCKFKTEDGGLFCEVCSWYASDGISSFLDHCNSRDHRKKMKDRFDWEEDNSQIAEINKWISELGLIYVEPESENFVRCKLCEKLFPAGKSLETFLLNVGIHVEGKAHVNNLEQSLGATKIVVNLMQAIQKSPNGSLPNLNAKIYYEKQRLKKKTTKCVHPNAVY